MVCLERRISSPRDYDLDVLRDGDVRSTYQTGKWVEIAAEAAVWADLVALRIQGVHPGLAISYARPIVMVIAIEVDLKEAYNNPSARPLIQPGTM